MTEDIILTEKIERYLDGNMVPDEKMLFEQSLMLDPDLAYEVNLHKEIMTSIKEHFVRKKIKDVASSYFKNYFIIGYYSLHKRNTILAAAILFISGSLLMLTLTLTRPLHNPNFLYQAIYSPYISGFNCRNATEPSDPLLSQAHSFYSRGRYPAALRAFGQLLKTDSLNQEVLFYTGLSAMGCNDFNRAAASFSQIRARQNPYYFPANWYLGLSLLKLDKEPEARKAFETVANSNSHYRNNATKILEGIK